MKKMNLMRRFAGILAVLLIVGSICTLPAYAGSSETVMDDSTIGEEISAAVWNNPTGEVTAKDGVILFSKDSSASARLITKTAARISDTDNLASVSGEFTFSKLPKGKKFILAFGLPNVEAKPGNAGNIEIAFEDKNGLCVSVTEYAKDGSSNTLLKTTSCKAGKSLAVEAVVTTDGKLKVEIAGSNVLKAKLSGTGEGRIGFLETGSCDVTISNVKVCTYKYDTPENCNISEDFESGTFNKNALTSKMVYQSYEYYPSKASVEEYEGSKVFMFYNSQAAYIGTKYEYSNFEISFDVPYFARENELDEENNVVRPKTEAFGVAFGGEAADYNDWGYTSSSDMILFRNTSQIISMNNEDVVVQDADYLFADPKQGKPFSVKISMIDSVITVSIKWMHETSYKKVLTYQINRETPTGYVQIWTTGLTNFAIDNLKIKNKDKNANLVEVPYESALIEKPADYAYEPLEMVYQEVQEEEEAPSYYLLIPLVAGLCVLVFGILIVIKQVRKKKKIKSVVSSMLVMTLLLGMLAGCTGKTNNTVEVEPMEIEEVASYSFEAIGGEDVMPIAGYYMPFASIHSIDGNAMPDYLTEEYFQLIADCGVNLITYPTVDYATTPTLVQKSLDLAAKYGIGMTVLDTNVTGLRGNGINSDLTVDEAVESMSNYMTHPGFAGMFMYDEPLTNYYGVPDGEHVLSSYSQISEVLNKEIGVWSYQNLVGIWDMAQTEAFDQYLTEFCETQNPNNLIFDVYPFDEKTRGKHDVYLYNLATYREFSEKYNIPWWSFIQAGSQWNDEQAYFESTTPYYPNEGEFDWSVNLNLAFGAKGLNYFPLFQPYYFAYGSEEGSYDFERNGLFGTWGNKNQWYYYAQDINEHIAVIDEVLMNSVSKGILATGEQSKVQTKYTRDALIKGSSWRELSDVDGDALIGCFSYQGKTALYVVNYSYEYAQDITLKFGADYKVKVVQDAKTTYAEGNGLTLHMPAGDGVLIVFE